MNILIIEDEPKTAADLRKIIKEINGDYEVIISPDSIESSVEYLNKNEMPDLIFMDIQLADGLSFEIFKEVEIVCPVIFVTAYDEYAADAFKTNGIAYVLKPFDKQTVEDAFGKYKNLAKYYKGSVTFNDKIKKVHEEYTVQKKSTFLIESRGKYFPLEIKSIAFISVENGLTFVKTFDQKTYNVDYSLDDLEGKIDSHQFFRANRQFIVNFDAITEIEPYFHRKLIIKLKISTKNTIVVSKAKAASLREWIENY